MRKEITIAQLDIDIKKFEQKALMLKKKIEGLKTSLKTLKKDTGVTTKEYVKQETELKRLSGQYNLATKNINLMKNSMDKTAVATIRSKNSISKLGNSIRTAFSRFVGFTIISTAIFGFVRAIRDAVKRVVEFDKTMTNLSSVLRINRKEIRGLESDIIELASKSTKTSNEVANLAIALATLGKTKSEIRDLLKPVNDLSIGLQSTSEDAGNLLVNTLNAFGKGTEEAKRYADIIANMRISTSLDFEKIKDALGFLAPTANAAGISLEQTGAILGVLVSNGIKASRAGRLMSSSFLRLSKKGLTLNDALDKINDAQQIGVSKTQLLSISTKLLGQRSAALGLILASNRDKTQELTDKFVEQSGVLDKLVKKQLESISAKTNILNSAWEKLIFTIDKGNGSLSKFSKSALENLTKLLNFISDINTASKADSNYAKTILAIIGPLAIFNKGLREKIRLTAKEVRQKEDRQSAIENLLKLLKKESERNKETFYIETERNLLLTESTENIKKHIKQLEKKEIEENKVNEAKKKREASDRESKNKRKEDEAKYTEFKKHQSAERVIDLKKGLDKELAIIDEQFRQKLAKVKKGSVEERILLEQEADAKIAKSKEFEIKADEQLQKLKNDIRLKNAENQEQRRLEKEQIDFENKQIEIENSLLLDSDKYEQLESLRIAHENRVQGIIEDSASKKARLLLRYQKTEERTQKKIASANISIVRSASRILEGIFGNNLILKFASVVADAVASIAKIKVSAATAKATNMAAAVSVGFPQNIPLIKAASVQNKALGVQSKIQQGLVIASGVFNLGKSLLKGKGKYTGGVIDDGTPIPKQMRNSGGDDVLIQAKKGEVVLNEEQQERAGGGAFFSSIGVPGFASGGFVGDSTINNITNSKIDVNGFADIIAQKINDIKVVAVVDDITDAQFKQTEIIDGANI